MRTPFVINMYYIRILFIINGNNIKLPSECFILFKMPNYLEWRLLFVLVLIKKTYLLTINKFEFMLNK